MFTLASALREMFGVQLYKNNARALLSRILSILNLNWLQHARSVRGVYEYDLMRVFDSHVEAMRIILRTNSLILVKFSDLHLINKWHLKYTFSDAIPWLQRWWDKIIMGGRKEVCDYGWYLPGKKYCAKGMEGCWLTSFKLKLSKFFVNLCHFKSRMDWAKHPSI